MERYRGALHSEDAPTNHQDFSEVLAKELARLHESVMGMHLKIAAELSGDFRMEKIPTEGRPREQPPAEVRIGGPQRMILQQKARAATEASGNSASSGVKERGGAQEESPSPPTTSLGSQLSAAISPSAATKARLDSKAALAGSFERKGGVPEMIGARSDGKESGAPAPEESPRVPAMPVISIGSLGSVTIAPLNGSPQQSMVPSPKIQARADSRAAVLAGNAERRGGVPEARSDGGRTSKGSHSGSHLEISSVDMPEVKMRQSSVSHHLASVASRMPVGASRQASRIDDFDKIIAEGYRNYRRKQRNEGTDDAGTASTQLFQKKVMISQNVIEPTVCAVLVINALLIGVNMDVEPDWKGWLWVDLVFVSVYSLEIVLKLALLGFKEFVTPPNLWWNLFDVAIIVVALFGVMLALFDSGGLNGSIVIVRLVRLARITRMIRLLRFEFFKELLTMVAGLVSGLRTLFWAFVLLGFAIYPMSLVLTQFLGQGSDTKNDREMQELFGTVPRSVLTVFRCVTGDCTYSNGTPAILDLVHRYGNLWIFMYMFVMLVVTFGLFNLIMAIFVDNAMWDAKRQERDRKLSRLKDRSRQRENTSKLLAKLLEHVIEAQIDDINSGLTQMTHMAVLKETFEFFMMDPEVSILLDDLDVPEEERLEMFEVLDANGNGSIQLEELINGIIKLRGDPRRSDVIHVLLVIRSLQEEMQNFRDFVSERLEVIQGDVQQACTVKL